MRTKTPRWEGGNIVPAVQTQSENLNYTVIMRKKDCDNNI